jgi:carboxymethylenebutenolidase
MGQWLAVPVDALRMRCYCATPPAGAAPGIIVCMHGPGIDEFIQEICERLAVAGFSALAPDLYHRQSQPLVEAWTKVRDTEALADLDAARNAMQALPGIDPQRLGVVGFCMGGRLAFLYAAHVTALRAAVVFHGGNIMVARDGMPSPLAQAGSIGAPLLGLFGADDTNPSSNDVHAIDAELTRLGKEHEFHIYAGAGHAFLNFTRPAVFRETQAQDAWARCVAWLQRLV